MNVRHTIVAALLVCGTGLALAQVPGPGTSVAVFGDRYVWNGQMFDDLDAIDTAMRPRQAPAVTLAPCDAAAGRPLLALAHRLRDLNLALLAASEEWPSCKTASSARPSQGPTRQGTRPHGIDDAAVERWWRSLMP